MNAVAVCVFYMHGFFIVMCVLPHTTYITMVCVQTAIDWHNYLRL
jgi:hypothetical protein